MDSYSRGPWQSGRRSTECYEKEIADLRKEVGAVAKITARAKEIAACCLRQLASTYPDVSLDAIMHDREGRDLDEDPETLWLIGRASGATEAAGIDIDALIAEVQPDPPETMSICSNCDNGEGLDPGEACDDCENVGKDKKAG